MSPPSEVNLEKLRFRRKEIDNVAWKFRTGAVIIPDVRGYLSERRVVMFPEVDKPDVYGYEGRLSDRRRVIMFPEVDIKSRWYSECEGTGKSGFIYSDELKILSRLHHENFLPFIGYCDENNVFFQHDDVHGDKVLRMSVE
ncbi:hypothetical protein Tco_1288555 [Tanacetum coccineum]